MVAPWRSPLARSLHQHRRLPHSRYLQLATVAPNGEPANRTVVFRGFAAESDDLQFVTDRRSAKIQHLQVNPRAEACWYFVETREQYRIAGRVELVTGDDRLPLWEALSAKARQQFAWPHPGQPRSPAEAFAVAVPAVPPETFCGLRLCPDRVERLALRGDPQDRWYYWLGEGTWHLENWNP
ncbi:MAG: Npun_F5749 family FMN-dependent PPOX-type flavoprotein [Pseudanabaenaceae cyanobacterium]